jgi:DNA-binding NtrC family response regulator
MILTGYPSLESAIEALRAGAFDYLIKPVLDLDLVTQKVSRALERRRLLQQAYRGDKPTATEAVAQAQALARQAGALRAAVDGGKTAEAKELAKAVDDAAQELARRLGRG